MVAVGICVMDGVPSVFALFDGSVLGHGRIFINCWNALAALEADVPKPNKLEASLSKPFRLSVKHSSEQIMSVSETSLIISINVPHTMHLPYGGKRLQILEFLR